MTDLPNDRKDYVTLDLKGNAIDVLWQLFQGGPTWDGNLTSKEGRNTLLELGLAQAYDGWQSLTAKGLAEAVSRGFDRKKGW